MTRWFFLLVLILTTETIRADELSTAEKKAGFVSLLAGNKLDEWDHKNNWKVDAKGVLTREGKGGGITYKKKKVPDNFELRFDWKVGKGSNSGVYYRPGQYEYQILDNQVHGDGKNPRTSAASLYFCMAPSKDATKPVGEWNEAKIVCQGTVIQHWLNGERVVDFDYTDAKWAKEVQLLKVRGADLASRGAMLHIQDHGDPVWYRNLRMREIPKAEKIDHQDVTPLAIPQAYLEREKAFVESQTKKKAK